MNRKLTNYFSQGRIPLVANVPHGRTVYWASSDTEENFKLNPKPGYTATSITYSYNNYGFRENAFDLNNGKTKILCMGCSQTEGIGLPVEDVWVSKIKQTFPEYDVYNLGVSGAGADTVIRILINCVTIFKPIQVYILWPPEDRYEIFDPAPRFKGAWNCEKHELVYFEESQIYNNQMKNKFIAQMMSQVYNFKLFELVTNQLYSDTEFQILGQIAPARDDHMGPTQHTAIYQKFMEQFNAS